MKSLMEEPDQQLLKHVRDQLQTEIPTLKTMILYYITYACSVNNISIMTI